MSTISQEEDQLLLKQIRAKDRAAFDEVYQKYWKFAYNSAYKRLEDTDAAKDICQDVFTQLWIQLTSETASGIENLPAYLYVAVRNNVFKWMEKEGRYVPVSDLLLQLDRKNDRADAQFLFNELWDAYQQVLETLPKQQRLFFRMRYQEELSSTEIAAQLSLSDKTVRNQLGRALSKIKAALLLSLTSFINLIGSL